MKESVFFVDGFGNILRAKMIERGLGAKALAELIGLTYEGTRQVLKENGSSESVYKVCKALKVNMKSIMKKNLI